MKKEKLKLKVESPAGKKEFFIKYEDWVAEQKLQKQLFNENLNDYCNANSGLKDKLRTTPDSHIKKLKLNLTVNWSKVFKRGWLIFPNKKK